MIDIETSEWLIEEVRMSLMAHNLLFIKKF